MGQVISLGNRLQVVRTSWQTQIHRENLQRERQIAAAREHTSRQRAKRLRRLANWANRQTIKAMYELANRLTIETGILHEVDHIIPLIGKTVSGLHVENNLRVVTRDENRKKSNHYAE